MNNTQQLLEIRALNADMESLMAKTSGGAINVSWNSVTHAYIFDLRGYKTVVKPVFILKVQLDKNSSVLLSLSSERIGAVKMMVDGKIIMKLSMSQISVDKNIDAVFSEVVSKICDHFTWTYIDEPLRNFLKNGSANFPRYPDEESIIKHCEELEEDLAVGGEEMLEDSIREIHESAAPTTAKEKWVIGAEIDGIYTVKDILYGGMGVVYVIEDSAREKTYALKTFKDEFIYDTTVCNQFIREAEIWTKLGKHRNIVQAERLMIREGQPYIFLEFINGKELEEIIRNGRLSPLEALDYSLQLCNGMIYAWSLMGLIHRDLKPANCFITTNNVLKISDFGLGTMSFAKKESTSGDVQGGDILGTSAIVGTLPYMAPELFMGGHMASTRTDIYAFGIIFCEMLTGVNPFFDEDPSEIIDRHLNLEPSLFDYPNDNITPELDCIFKKCIEKQPENRYVDFEEIYEDLSILYEELSGSEFKKTSHESFSEEDLIKRGLSLANLRQYNEAVKVYDQAIKINPRSPAILHKGKALAALGQYDKAHLALNEFIKIHDSYWRVWLYKGEVYTSSKEYDKALQCLNKASELSPDNPEILSAIGRLKGEMGNISEAIELCEESLELDEQMPQTWFQLGYYYMLQDKYEAAKDAFVEASEINPRYIEAWAYRGKSFYKLGFYKESILAFSRALSMDPNYMECLSGMAEACMATGDKKMAADCYAQIFGKGKIPVEAVIGKAKLLEMNYRYEDAIELLSRYASKFPDNELLRLKLAKLYLKILDPKHVKEILASDSSNGNIQEGLRQAMLDSADSCLRYMDVLEEELSIQNAVSYDVLFADLNSFLSYICDIEYGVYILKKALNSCGDHKIKALSYLAILEKACGRDYKAEAAYGEAAALAPKDPFVTDIGRCLFPKKKDVGIFHMIETKRFANSQDGMLIEGLIELSKKNYPKALAAFQNCYAKYPEAHSCLVFCSELLLKMKDTAKAEGFLDDFIKIFPNSFGYYRKKILTTEKRYNISAIERWIKKIISLVPYFSEPWLYYINLLREYGQTEKSMATALFFIERYIDKISIDKDSVEISRLLGFLNQHIGRYEAAKIHYSEVCSSSPGDYTALCGLTLCNIKLEAYLEAEQLLKSEPLANTPITQYLSAILALKKDADAALTFTGDQNLMPTSTIMDLLLMTRIKILFEMGDVANAEIYVDSLRGLYKNLPFLLYYKRLLSKRTSVHAYMDADQFKTSNVYILKTAVRALYENGDKVQAAELLSKSLSINSLDIEANIIQGVIFYDSKEYAQALFHFNQAVILDCLNPDLWTMIGASSMHLGDTEQAKAAFESIMELDFPSKNSLINYSVYLLETGKLIHAQQFAEKALRIDNSSYHAWIVRGRCLKRYGNLDDALASADSALINYPDDARGWILKGSVQIEQDDIQGSVYTLRKASEINENEPSIWYNLGVALLKEKKYELAASYAKKAVKLDLNFFEGLYLYGVCLFIIGEHEKHNICMQKAKTCNPTKYEKWVRLKEIKNDIKAPLKSIDTSLDPFFIFLPSKTQEPPLLRFSDFTPVFYQDTEL